MKFKIGDHIYNEVYQAEIINIEDGYHVKWKCDGMISKYNKFVSTSGIDVHYELDKEWIWNQQLKELLE